jgi:hypothetical protein
MKKFIITAICMTMVFATGLAFGKKYNGKKVLFIDSYHEEYAWSDGITRGVQSTLEGRVSVPYELIASADQVIE